MWISVRICRVQRDEKSKLVNRVIAPVIRRRLSETGHRFNKLNVIFVD